MGTKDPDLARRFAATLRRLREAAGLSQADLAARMRPVRNLQAISRYEAGDRVPTLSVLYQLARALGVPPCDLLPGGERPPGRPRKEA